VRKRAPGRFAVSVMPAIAAAWQLIAWRQMPIGCLVGSTTAATWGPFTIPGNGRGGAEAVLRHGWLEIADFAVRPIEGAGIGHVQTEWVTGVLKQLFAILPRQEPSTTWNLPPPRRADPEVIRRFVFCPSTRAQPAEFFIAGRPARDRSTMAMTRMLERVPARMWMSAVPERSAVHGAALCFDNRQEPVGVLPTEMSRCPARGILISAKLNQVPL